MVERLVRRTAPSSTSRRRVTTSHDGSQLCVDGHNRRAERHHDGAPQRPVIRSPMVPARLPQSESRRCCSRRPTTGSESSSGMAAAHGIAHPSSDGRVNGSNRYSGTAALRMSPISSSPALQRHLVQLVDPDVSHARIDMGAVNFGRSVSHRCAAGKATHHAGLARIKA